jgi:hypothetical protein
MIGSKIINVEFSVRTQKRNSEVTEIVEIQVPKNANEAFIEMTLNKAYLEWQKTVLDGGWVILSENE